MDETITRARLAHHVVRINRLLRDLAETAPEFAAMYRVPDNPTPNHLTRMLDDLEALLNSKDCSAETLDSYETVVREVEALRARLYRATAYEDAFSEFC